MIYNLLFYIYFNNNIKCIKYVFQIYKIKIRNISIREKSYKDKHFKNTNYYVF